jgi:hypothetical protein
MGFGLIELRQLWDMIGEITEANKISHHEAVSKFFKDVQEQYDSKPGFEVKVNEKRGELALINRELNNSQQILLSVTLIGPSLSNLLQNGIGQQDIISINQLVENSTKDIDKSNKITSKSEYWKKLIEELKEYENVKLAIKEQQENHDRLQKQVNYLDKQKQEILKYLQIAIYFINTINNRIYYYKGLVDQFNNDLNYYKFNVLGRPSYPFIFIRTLA